MVMISDTSNSAVKKRTSQGRKKIAIEKIQSLSSRQVTFSKRRVGIFKKASELCILTNAAIAIVVHSLGKRVFTFGHPSTDSVIDRFLNGGDARQNRPPMVIASREYNDHYSDVCQKLDMEKKRKEVIEEENGVAGGYSGGGGIGGGFWWDEAADGMEIEELEKYAAALEELKKNVAIRTEDLMLVNNSNSFTDPAAVGRIESNLSVGSCSLGDTDGVGGPGPGKYYWF